MNEPKFKDRFYLALAFAFSHLNFLLSHQEFVNNFQFLGFIALLWVNGVRVYMIIVRIQCFQPPRLTLIFLQ